METYTFESLRSQLSFQLPTLLVCVVGLIIVVMKLRRYPMASLLAGGGLLLKLLIVIGSPVFYRLVFPKLYGGNFQLARAIDKVSMIVFSLLGALSYLLLLMAVYVGRKVDSPIGVLPNIPPKLSA